jgi:hypothetical protein
MNGAAAVIIWGGGGNSPQWTRDSTFTRFLDHTQRRKTQSVRLLWTSDQLVADTSTDNTQHSQQTDRGLSVLLSQL